MSQLHHDRIHLLSCPSCRRQLDVSRMEPGDQVVCVCDAELVVGPPQEVTIGGLCCGHCGGVISSHDADCPYCKAKLSAEDKKATTLCPCCAARLPNDSRHCKSCGVLLRAAALPALPKDAACPRCTSRLRVHLLETGEIIECADGCGGMWCQTESFERLQAQSRIAALTGQATEAPVDVPVEDESGTYATYVPCLTCGELMNRTQYSFEGRASGIVLDVCKNHGVWFDRDELNAALAFVRRTQLVVERNPGGYVNTAAIGQAPGTSRGASQEITPGRDTGAVPFKRNDKSPGFTRPMGVIDYLIWLLKL